MREPVLRLELGIKRVRVIERLKHFTVSFLRPIELRELLGDICSQQQVSDIDGVAFRALQVVGGLFKLCPFARNHDRRGGKPRHATGEQPSSGAREIPHARSLVEGSPASIAELFDRQIETTSAIASCSKPRAASS